MDSTEDMTSWDIAYSDLLDAHADGLLCSANRNLNLSGGVGGAFSLRFGDSMQLFLHDHLHKNNLRFIEPGHSVIAPPLWVTLRRRCARGRH